MGPKVLVDLVGLEDLVDQLFQVGLENPEILAVLVDLVDPVDLEGLVALVDHKDQVLQKDLEILEVNLESCVYSTNDFRYVKPKFTVAQSCNTQTHLNQI